MTRLRTFAVALSLGAAIARPEQAAMPDTTPAAPSLPGRRKREARRHRHRLTLR